MKNKSVFLPIFLIALAFLLFASCKDKKNEIKSESPTEIHALTTYQCPMDCEDGKTYDEAGSCPVCKMDLKQVNKGVAMSCSMHKDGKCNCEGAKCKCANCPEHSKNMTCTVHKDGKCTCEGDKCKCTNCPMHT